MITHFFLVVVLIAPLWISSCEKQGKHIDPCTREDLISKGHDERDKATFASLVYCASMENRVSDELYAKYFKDSIDYRSKYGGGTECVNDRILLLIFDMSDSNSRKHVVMSADTSGRVIDRAEYMTIRSLDTMFVIDGKDTILKKIRKPKKSNAESNVPNDFACIRRIILAVDSVGQLDLSFMVH